MGRNSCGDETALAIPGVDDSLTVDVDGHYDEYNMDL